MLPLGAYENAGDTLDMASIDISEILGRPGRCDGSSKLKNVKRHLSYLITLDLANPPGNHEMSLLMVVQPTPANQIA